MKNIFCTYNLHLVNEHLRLEGTGKITFPSGLGFGVSQVEAEDVFRKKAVCMDGFVWLVTI